MLAILGAAAALAGTTLVFLGLIVTAYQGASGSTSEELRARYVDLSWMMLLAFMSSILCVALATAWLVVAASSSALYVITVATFFVSLAGLPISTSVVVTRLLARRR